MTTKRKWREDLTLAVKVGRKTVGHVFAPLGETGDWESECAKTGMSWGTDKLEDAVEILLDHNGL